MEQTALQRFMSWRLGDSFVNTKIGTSQFPFVDSLMVPWSQSSWATTVCNFREMDICKPRLLSERGISYFIIVNRELFHRRQRNWKDTFWWSLTLCEPIDVHFLIRTANTGYLDFRRKFKPLRSISKDVGDKLKSRLCSSTASRTLSWTEFLQKPGVLIRRVRLSLRLQKPLMTHLQVTRHANLEPTKQFGRSSRDDQLCFLFFLAAYCKQNPLTRSILFNEKKISNGVGWEQTNTNRTAQESWNDIQ